jgi:predicted transcriptional regulator
MAKAAISIRLGDEELRALDQIAMDSALNRSRVIEAIIRHFLQQEFAAQSSALRSSLGVRRHPKPPSRQPKRWAT